MVLVRNSIISQASLNFMLPKSFSTTTLIKLILNYHKTIWNYHQKTCWDVVVRSNSHVVLKNKNSRKTKSLPKLVHVSWLLGKLDFCSH